MIDVIEIEFVDFIDLGLREDLSTHILASHINRF